MRKLFPILFLALLSTASMAARNTNFLTTDPVNVADGNNALIQVCAFAVDNQPKFYIPATFFDAVVSAPAMVLCKWPTASLALGAHTARVTFATGLPGSANFIESAESMPTLNFVIVDDTIIVPAPLNLRDTHR